MEAKVDQKYVFIDTSDVGDLDNGKIVEVVGVGDGYVEYAPGFYESTGRWPVKDFLKYFTPVETADAAEEEVSDVVNHPAHYTQYPVEIIEITEHLNFCRGNAVKYVARAGLKDKSKEIEDLRKAVWYIEREIARLEN